MLKSALEELQNDQSACSLFEELLNFGEVFIEKVIVDVKMLREEERLHIFDLLDKIVISVNEIPWLSITLPLFKFMCDLFLFENMLFGIIADIIPSKNLMSVLKSVDQKFERFFFSGLLHFKKMNIKIVDANSNAQKSESSVVCRKEEFLMHTIERIKNCDTIQDLIDSSPNEECPVCLDVTFTESTDFVFRVSCNHLVCSNCDTLLAKYNNYRLVKNILFLFFHMISWMFLFKIFYNVDPFLLNSGWSR